MTRIVVMDGRGPIPMKKDALPQGEFVFLCKCGLSKNAPFCDGIHKNAREEADKRIYYYEVANGEQVRRDVTEAMLPMLVSK